MDPKATLNLASQYLRAGQLEEASCALQDYADWRGRGGFEPEGGDCRALYLWRDLARAEERRKAREAEITPPWPMSCLDPNAVREAAHSLYALEYASVYEERGGKLPCGVELCGWVPKLPDSIILPVVWRHIGHIEACLGQSLSGIFYHAGLKEGEGVFLALSDLLLGVCGHGVTWRDDFADAFSRAEDILGIRMSNLPHLEGEEYRSLAEEYCPLPVADAA